MTTGDGRFIGRVLDVIEEDIAPRIERGVARGDKVFGAAILLKSDLSLVVAGANNETANPLWHGEVSTLKSFFELPRAGRPNPGDCYFVSTHEPCPLCLAAITWAGFDNFYFLFNYADTADAFAIPHDLRIHEEVFGVRNGRYRRENAYWKAYRVGDLVDASPADEREVLKNRIAVLRKTFDEMSAAYQAGKDGSDIPLA